MSTRLYFAAPLFTAAEQAFNAQLAQQLDQLGWRVFLPQVRCAGLTTSQAIYGRCLEGLTQAEVVVAILDGADADSGTCWECGYAVGQNIPVVAVRTDFRQSGDTRGFNAMLLHSAAATVEAKTHLATHIHEALCSVLALSKP
ncbi:MAG: nucleoside 2-deoxyribosyltransferase [Spirulinaceae cyanobacterium SM2_1_0]|nr:nucleoside 2-deoxyribosyltransferase [Spirulinaceae cyanobacterium SM2_1_0]